MAWTHLCLLALFQPGKFPSDNAANVSPNSQTPDANLNYFRCQDGWAVCRWPCGGQSWPCPAPIGRLTALLSYWWRSTGLMLAEDTGVYGVGRFSTEYSKQFILHNIQYTVKSKNYTACNVPCSVYSINYKVFIMNFRVYSLKFRVYTIQFTAYILIMQWTLVNSYYFQPTVQCKAYCQQKYAVYSIHSTMQHTPVHNAMYTAV